jgi:hypothetical protein
MQLRSLQVKRMKVRLSQHEKRLQTAVKETRAVADRSINSWEDMGPDCIRDRYLVERRNNPARTRQAAHRAGKDLECELAKHKAQGLPEPSFEMIRLRFEFLEA